MGQVPPLPPVLVRSSVPKMPAGLTLIEQAEWQAEQESEPPRGIPLQCVHCGRFGRHGPGCPGHSQVEILREGAA